MSESESYIVVASIDFSASSLLALDEAVRVASEHPGATLHVVHVASAYGPMLQMETAGDVLTMSAEEAEAYLASYVQQHSSELRAKGLGIDPARVSSHLRVGGATDAIVAAAAELDADLLVVGTHGRTGVKRMLLGSVAEGVVRKAGCQVLVVRAKDYELVRAEA
jgi:nucleotide-binding universal stress UspA family protein